MADIISYVLSGIAIAVALVFLLIPNRGLGKKVALIAAGCAAIGLFAPAVGFYVWMVLIVVLFVAAVVGFVRGLASVRW